MRRAREIADVVVGPALVALGAWAGVAAIEADRPAAAFMWGFLVGGWIGTTLIGRGVRKVRSSLNQQWKAVRLACLRLRIDLPEKGGYHCEHVSQPGGGWLVRIFGDGKAPTFSEAETVKEEVTYHQLFVSDEDVHEALAVAQ